MSLIYFVEQENGGYLLFHKNGAFLGDAYKEVDGLYVFIPDTKLGAWTEHILYEIADFLASLNKDWIDNVNEELEKAAQSAQMELDFDENRVDIIGTNGNDGLHYG